MSKRLGHTIATTGSLTLAAALTCSGFAAAAPGQPGLTPSPMSPGQPGASAVPAAPEPVVRPAVASGGGDSGCAGGADSAEAVCICRRSSRCAEPLAAP